MDIIITIPKSVSWDDYQKELDRAALGEILNFKVSNFPKVQVGDRCYLCHDGFIKGYMLVSGLSEKPFKCTTTGREWSGKFIQRTGDFYPVKYIPMVGFQGVRYFYNTGVADKLEESISRALD